MTAVVKPTVTSRRRGRRAISRIVAAYFQRFRNSDSPQRRLSSRLEPSSREFRLAVKLGVVSGYVSDSKHFQNVNQHTEMMNVRYIYIDRLYLCN